MFRADGVGCTVAYVIEESATAAQRTSGRRRQREWLEEWQRRRHGGLAEGGDRRIDGPGNTDHQRERREELGHILRQRPIARARLGVAEVDDPRLPMRIEHHVLQAQVAMSDPARLQARDLLPQRSNGRIVEGLLATLADDTPVDALQHEHARAAMLGRDRDRSRRVHAHVRGERGEERFVLDALLRRGERGLVLDMAKGDVATDRGEGVGVAPVAVDCLDEDRRTVAGDADIGRCIAAVILDPSELPHRAMTRGKHTTHGVRVDRPARRADREVHDGTHRRAESEPADDVQRRMGADVDARDRDEHRGRPGAAPGRPGKIRDRRRHECGRDRGMTRRVAEPGDARAPNDHVGEELEWAPALHPLPQEVRAESAETARQRDRKRHPPLP